MTPGTRGQSRKASRGLRGGSSRSGRSHHPSRMISTSPGGARSPGSRDTQAGSCRRRRCRCWPGTAKPPIADANATLRISVNGDILDLNRWWMDFGLVNMTGHPAISIPCGKFDDGCPIGIHVIGRWDGEQDLIDLASRIEATEPWLRRWSANR